MTYRSISMDIIATQWVRGAREAILPYLTQPFEFWPEHLGYNGHWTQEMIHFCLSEFFTAIKKSLDFQCSLKFILLPDMGGNIAMRRSNTNGRFAYRVTICLETVWEMLYFNLFGFCPISVHLYTRFALQTPQATQIHKLSTRMSVYYICCPWDAKDRTWSFSYPPNSFGCYPFSGAPVRTLSFTFGAWNIYMLQRL